MLARRRSNNLHQRLFAQLRPTFTRYFSDRQYSGARKALTAAEKRLKELRELLDGARRVNGKLTQTTIRKANKMLDADR